nr:uncharacterized protein LOC111514610 [Leptinotarsa decemlineata]
MEVFKKLCSKLVFVFVFCVVVSNATSTKTEITKNDAGEFVGRMMEQGRTLVHHAMKRFMIILPAIFFKLGIAFTMLVLVTIVSVNNGVIGFLLLVVGLSSVLARLQGSSKPAAVPYISPVPVFHNRYYQDWDRRDKGSEETSSKGYNQGLTYSQQYTYPQLGAYNPSYFVQKT